MELGIEVLEYGLYGKGGVFGMGSNAGRLLVFVVECDLAEG